MNAGGVRGGFALIALLLAWFTLAGPSQAAEKY